MTLMDLIGSCVGTLRGHDRSCWILIAPRRFPVILSQRQTRISLCQAGWWAPANSNERKSRHNCVGPE